MTTTTIKMRCVSNAEQWNGGDIRVVLQAVDKSPDGENRAWSSTEPSPIAALQIIVTVDKAHAAAAFEVGADYRVAVERLS